MNKKLAIGLVLLGGVLVYLFLLVGLPAFGAQLDNPTSPLFCPDDGSCNARELFTPPLILYFMPGFVVVLVIVGIWKRKKEGKDE